MQAISPVAALIERVLPLAPETSIGSEMRISSIPRNAGSFAREIHFGIPPELLKKGLAPRKCPLARF